MNRIQQTVITQLPLTLSKRLIVFSDYPMTVEQWKNCGYPHIFKNSYEDDKILVYLDTAYGKVYLFDKSENRIKFIHDENDIISYYNDYTIKWLNGIDVEIVVSKISHQ